MGKDDKAELLWGRTMTNYKNCRSGGGGGGGGSLIYTRGAGTCK